MKRWLKSEKGIFLIVALFVTMLVWGIFFAQGIFSDIVTFGKGGDAGRQTFPAFIQLGYTIVNNIRDGVDIAITNGSNSIHADALEWYFVYRIFAVLGALFGRPLAFFVLFFALHMFLNMYMTEWLCFKNFGMNKRISVLVAVSVGASSLFNAWFTAFFVIYSLMLPLFYVLINLMKSEKKIALFLASLVYVTVFNSGYSTVSCFMAVVLFVAASFYSSMTYKELGFKVIALRLLLPVIIGAGVSFASLWNKFITMSGSGGTTLFDSLAIDMDITSWPSFFFFSYSNTINESGYFTFGIVWMFFLVAFILVHITKRMCRRNALLFKTVMIINILLVFVCMGKSFPFGKWFYEIPIFGLMHLRMRYMLTTLPFFYLAMGTGLQKLDFHADKKKLLISASVCAGGIIAIVSIYWSNFDKNYLLMEIGLGVVVVYYLFVENIKSVKFVVLTACYLLSFHTNKLYAIWSVSSHSNEFVYSSIADNSGTQATLDNYVSGLEQKEIYKYIGLETDDAVPYFIMNNYGWYHYQQYDLCNYLRYALHGGSINSDYIDNINVSWFDEFNWEYLFDTRADFVVLSQAVVDEKTEFYNEQVMDDTYKTYLSNDYFAVKVKKYIPRHYTGGERTLDESDSFDNGYFYSPILQDEDVANFDTDKASYFKLEFNAGESGDIQFSMNPSSYYTYYIDGEEIEPTVDYGLVYFPVTEGNHTIEVKYHNTLTITMGYIYDVYYGLIALAAIGLGIVTIKGKRRKKKAERGK